MAAVQAHRMGKSVVLVGPDTHLGGLSASGLGGPTRGQGRHRRPRASSTGASTRVRARRVALAAPKTTATAGKAPPSTATLARWTFEPHVAEEVFEALVWRASRSTAAWLDRTADIEVVDGRIRPSTLAGARFAGDVFIDATYEGDLMAAAGVSYTVGQESNDAYGETLAGVQTRRARSRSSTARSTRVVPGDPSSGCCRASTQARRARRAPATTGSRRAAFGPA